MLKDARKKQEEHGMFVRRRKSREKEKKNHHSNPNNNTNNTKITITKTIMIMIIILLIITREWNVRPQSNGSVHVVVDVGDV